MSTTTATAKVLGTTEDYTGCDCCGRANLKVYVVVDHGDRIAHYGTSCAAAILDRADAEIRKAARSADQERADAARRARAAADCADDEAFLAWVLDTHSITATSPADIVRQTRGTDLTIGALRAAYRNR